MNMYRNAAVVLICVALAYCTNGGWTRVVDLPSHEVAAKPEWDDPSTWEANPQDEPSVVEIHLDISYPMAGFLPLAQGDDGLSTLHVIAQNVFQHMARVYGATDVDVRWRGVGDDLLDLPPSPLIQRGLFNGRSTRIDLSIENILSDFQSGRAEAAALVTDLMATGDVIGPLVVANELSEWLQSDDVRSNEFHVALLGVKAPYWGVTHPEECPPGPRYGCWYDERVRRFQRLERVEQFPIYVLVFGRGAESVTSVMESLQRGIREIDPDLETQVEVVTRKTRGFDTVLSCRAGTPAAGGEHDDQYALYTNNSGQYDCRRDSTVTLFCDFGDSFLPTEARAIWSTAPTTGELDSSVRDDTSGTSSEQSALPPAAVRVLDAQPEVDIDCSAIRSAPSESSGLELGLDVTGRANRSNDEVDWSEWSTEVGALGKTLQLDDFVQEIRIEPDRYRVELPRLLHFPGR